MQTGFDDRTVNLQAPEQLETVANAIASGTRIAILRALARSPKPLHINEVARQVGIDASPARSHLETLVKAGLAREVTAPVGRQRLFMTTLTDVRLTLEGVNRSEAPERAGPPPRTVVRLERKLAAMNRDMGIIASKAQKVKAEIAAEWAKASRT